MKKSILKAMSLATRAFEMAACEEYALDEEIFEETKKTCKAMEQYTNERSNLKTIQVMLESFPLK